MSEKFTDKDREYIDKAIAMITVKAGDLVKKLRAENNNMSIRELSLRSGVSIAVISELECYKSLPKIDVLIRLMYAFNVSFGTLFTILWYATDDIEWGKLCGRKPIHLVAQRRATLDDIKIGNKDITCDNTECLTLNKILAHEGLTTTDIKDVLDYISYVKYKRKK